MPTNANAARTLSVALSSVAASIRARLFSTFSAASAILHRSHRSHRIQLIAAFAAGVLVSGAMLAIAASMRVGPRAATSASASSPRLSSANAAHVAPAAEESALDLLRAQASVGDELSNWHLTKSLLDRYDATGNPSELYEAMVWIDRHWDVAGKAEAAPRVIAHYCGQRVARWHWMCNQGE